MNVDEFLDHLFPGVNQGDPSEAVCIAELVTPHGREPFWLHTRWKAGQLPRELGRHYFCISTVRCGRRDRNVRRRVQDLARTWVIGLDDVGTAAHSKVDPESLPRKARKPSFVLETSPGNHQYLYHLEPAARPDEAAALISALAEAGYTDKGAQGANRVLRLPGSLNEKHGTAFRTRIVS